MNPYLLPWDVNARQVEAVRGFWNKNTDKLQNIVIFDWKFGMSKFVSSPPILSTKTQLLFTEISSSHLPVKSYKLRFRVLLCAEGKRQ